MEIAVTRGCNVFHQGAERTSLEGLSMQQSSCAAFAAICRGYARHCATTEDPRWNGKRGCEVCESNITSCLQQFVTAAFVSLYTKQHVSQRIFALGQATNASSAAKQDIRCSMPMHPAWCQPDGAVKPLMSRNITVAAAWRSASADIDARTEASAPVGHWHSALFLVFHKC